MKKTLWLISLMALPTIISCNNDKAKRIDNQDQLMAAVTFKDISYAQVTFEQGDTYFQYTCSPTVYRCTTAENESSSEKFVEKFGEHYVEYTKDQVWDVNIVSKENFIAVNDLYNVLELYKIFSEASMFTKVLTYDDFDYIGSEYVCKITTDSEGNKINFALEFDNKRLRKIKVVLYEETDEKVGVFAFTYKEITPAVPVI